MSDGRTGYVSRVVGNVRSLRLGKAESDSLFQGDQQTFSLALDMNRKSERRKKSLKEF